MIAPSLNEIADQLLSGEIEPVTAGRVLKAQAEGVKLLEERCEKFEAAARAVVLNTIGLGAAVSSLENEIPRPQGKVDAA